MSKSSNYRLGKNDKERYSSLDEMRKAWGLKDIIKRTSNKNKLEEQREKFLRTCKCCGSPMVFVNNTNVCVCSNESCKGFKHTATNEDGTERVWYTPYVRILDNKGADIAQNLFD